MKKQLLSVFAIAIASFGFAQTNSITSGNTPNPTKDGYIFEFNGNAGANCTSEVQNEGNIKSSWNAKSTSIDTSGFANGQAVLTVDTTSGWSTTDGFVFIFSENNCEGINLDLSQNDTVEIKITSSVDVSNFYVALGDTSNSNLADEALFSQSMTAGEHIYKFEVSSWKTWNKKTVDSTNANYILMGFRKGGWGTEVIPGTFTIDYIKVGNQTGLVGLDEFVSNEASFSVFPNPVTNGVVNFSEIVEEVELYNVQGTLIKSESNTDKLDVEGLDAGIYVIQSTKGYKRVIIK